MSPILRRRHTDICGILSAAIVEETPVPTAAAMLRDIIAICRRLP